MSVFPFDPTRPKAAPSDLPSDAQHAGYADDGRDALDEALRASRLTQAFKAGRMTQAQARRVVERVIAVGRTDVADIARRLADGLKGGLASLGGWFKSMIRSIVPLHYASSFALLNTKTPAPADLLAIREASDGQVGFLARFRRNIASGLQRVDGSLTSRSEQYADAAWGLGFDVIQARMIRDGFDEARRVLGGTEQHCPECPALARLGWVEIRQARPIGRTVCRVRCRCHMIFR